MSRVRVTRARRTTGNAEYMEAAARFIRAGGRRVAAGDRDALAPLVALRAELETAIDTAVVGLVSNGYSLSEIGRTVGITKQAVHAKYRAAHRKGIK